MTNTSVRGVDRPTRGSRTHPATMQFANAEEAWLWTMGCLLARQQGARFGANKGLVRRPCEPDDVVKCLNALYQERLINLRHARVLRTWGERRQAPNPAYASETSDHLTWREAMERLQWPLRVKGIIA